jgi:hypothetical protein
MREILKGVLLAVAGVCMAVVSVIMVVDLFRDYFAKKEVK